MFDFPPSTSFLLLSVTMTGCTTQHQWNDSTTTLPLRINTLSMKSKGTAGGVVTCALQNSEVFQCRVAATPIHNLCHHALESCYWAAAAAFMSHTDCNRDKKGHKSPWFITAHLLHNQIEAKQRLGHTALNKQLHSSWEDCVSEKARSYVTADLSVLV